jgi:hypothetical protein
MSDTGISDMVSAIERREIFPFAIFQGAVELGVQRMHRVLTFFQTCELFLTVSSDFLQAQIHQFVYVHLYNIIQHNI